MPVRSHHTALSEQQQSQLSRLDDWTSEVLPRLPHDFEQQARHLHALQRSRAFSCPADLLRGLLLYVLSPFGFRYLGVWGVLSDLADLSAPAWHSALLRSSAWLLYLIAQLLVANDRPIWITQRVRRRVWIVDASMLGQVGQTGDAWRLHLAFDLVAGQVGQVHLSDRYTGERLDHFELMPGDLVLLDAGYAYRRTLALAQSKAADLLMPFTPRTCPLERSCGQELDVLAWLRQEGASLRERNAYWRYQGQRGQVRLIAKRLSEQQRRARERRLYHKAQKHARAVSEQALLLCGWMLLLSSLPCDSWTAEELLWLYRARWQVELVFKRIKQLLLTGQIRASSRAGAEATIRALLVAWLLQEQSNRQIQALLANLLPAPSEQDQQQERNVAVVSNWTLTVLSLETLRQQVQGHWNEERLRECLPRLRRFLTSRSARPHQESQIRAFLNGQSQSRQSAQRRAA